MILVSGSGASAAVSVFEDRFKPNMEVRLFSFYGRWKRIKMWCLSWWRLENRVYSEGQMFTANHHTKTKPEAKKRKRKKVMCKNSDPDRAEITWHWSFHIPPPQPLSLPAGGGEAAGARRHHCGDFLWPGFRQQCGLVHHHWGWSGVPARLRQAHGQGEKVSRFTHTFHQRGSSHRLSSSSPCNILCVMVRSPSPPVHLSRCPWWSHMTY